MSFLLSSDRWHNIVKLEATKKAAELLAKRGVVEIWPETNQYRLKETPSGSESYRAAHVWKVQKIDKGARVTKLGITLLSWFWAVVKIESYTACISFSKTTNRLLLAACNSSPSKIRLQILRVEIWLAVHHDPWG
jgi:hypothetical protein